MPELPEVETIVRQLKDKILGRTIIDLKIIDEKVVHKNVAQFLHAPIRSVTRRGKAIIISSEKKHLLAHLRMTGHFYHVTDLKDTSYKRYLTGIFYLDDGSLLTYNEIRRFGSVQYLSEQQLEQFLARFGPEPLQMTSHHFARHFQRFPGSVIKNKLLDQSVIAGIGNIYAQEALYHAGIRPQRKISSLSSKKLSLLHTELQRILASAIEKNGTSVNTYNHLDGKGDFQDFLAVYQKEKCPKNHPLQRVAIGGRGTYYCKVCQK